MQTSVRHGLLGLLVIVVALVSSCGASREERREARKRSQTEAQEAGTATTGGAQRFAIEVGGLRREYLLYVPSNYDGSRPVPLVMMFHGGGGSGERSMEETGWAKKAEQKGFLAAFPDGTRPKPDRRASFARNPQTWNDGSGRYASGEANIDDVSFVRAMLDQIESKYEVDPQRIYATGFSNGSSMTFRLGVELGERIAAIAPVGSSGLRLRNAKFRRAVPMIYIHGSADPRNPLEGGDVKNYGEVDYRPPLEETVRNWARESGCRPAAERLRDGGGVRAVAYRGCRGNADVDFYIVDGLGHVWPGGDSNAPKRLVGASSKNLNGTDVIWDFFERHPKQ